MRLLVVEDDAALGRALRRTLDADRHVVEVTDRGEDALEIVASGSVSRR